MRYNTTLAAIAVSLLCPALGADVVRPDAPVGSVQNGSFEKQDDEGGPESWTVEGRRRQRDSDSRALSDVSRDGERSLALGEAGAGRQFTTTVLVKPFASYRLTGYIKTEDVDSDSAGAVLAVRGQGISGQSEPVKGTQDWSRVAVEFQTGEQDSVYIDARLGSGRRQGRRGGPDGAVRRGRTDDQSARGAAYFDDLRLELIAETEFQPRVLIDVNARRQPMNELVYGQFIEHLGRCIYGGIWAEMLEDRKFYYPVTGEDVTDSSTGEPRTERNRTPWEVVGGEGAIATVTEGAYVGEHSTQVKLGAGGEAKGIAQDGLGVVEGKEYAGRVILRGDDSALPIRVVLDWGGGSDTFEITEISDEFETRPVRLTAGGSSDDASLSIVSSGSGSFTIGTASLMPADNVRGMRKDTLALLKDLKSPIYRWPGGNFVSGYNWKDGIGDVDKRPPRKNPAWRGVEHNDFGMHEFFAFLDEVDAEPFIALNTGLGSAELAVEEVEYVLGDSSTPMGKLRAENGRQEPWECAYWAVGNEMSGGWQLGNVPIEEYAKRHGEFAERLERFPGLKLVASGEAVAPYHRWDKVLLAENADNIDLNSKHFYRQNWHAGGLRTHVVQIPEAIRDIAVAHRRYLEEIPELEGKDVTVSLDEWNYWYGPHVFGELGTRYFLRDGLGIAAGILEFTKHTDVIEMANYAQTVNVIGAIKTNKTNAMFETTGLMLKMFRHRFGVIPVEVSGAPEPLIVAATLTDDEKALTVGVVNPTYESWPLSLAADGVALGDKATGWRVDGENEMAYNDPGEPQKFAISEEAITLEDGKVEITPLSASVIRIPLAE